MWLLPFGGDVVQVGAADRPLLGVVGGAVGGNLEEVEIGLGPCHALEGAS